MLTMQLNAKETEVLTEAMRISHAFQKLWKRSVGK
jgi:hypothetical protein